MGTVTHIRSHPRFQSLGDRQWAAFMKDWVAAVHDTQPVRKRIDFLRIGRTEEEYEELMQRYSGQKEVDDER